MKFIELHCTNHPSRRLHLRTDRILAVGDLDEEDSAAKACIYAVFQRERYVFEVSQSPAEILKLIAAIEDTPAPSQAAIGGFAAAG